MKKILVPTDFSQHAEYALRVAAQIAQKNQGEITLVHMLDLPNQNDDAVIAGSDIPEVMFFINKVRERFENVKNSDFLNNIPVTEVVQFGKAWGGILKYSEKHEIDLIVMGSHGASGFQEMFIGSNTEKVVRNSSVPVLVIKKEEKDFNIKNFVFASDFSDEIKAPFTKMLEFATMFGAHLHLVSINTPNNFRSTSVANKQLADFVSGFNLSNFSTHIYNEINVEKGVLNFSKEVNADLLGMCTHGRKGLAHFFNGSISEDLVNHSDRHILTIKI